MVKCVSYFIFEGWSRCPLLIHVNSGASFEVKQTIINLIVDLYWQIFLEHDTLLCIYGGSRYCKQKEHWSYSRVSFIESLNDKAITIYLRVELNIFLAGVLAPIVYFCFFLTLKYYNRDNRLRTIDMTTWIIRAVSAMSCILVIILILIVDKVINIFFVKSIFSNYEDRWAKCFKGNLSFSELIIVL